MARPSKIITKEDILRAQKMTRSNMAAARYLHISYNHYKKYAKMYKDEDGVTLLEAHKNQAGEGIPKFALAGKDKIPLMDLLEGRVPIEHFDARKIKQRLIFEGLIEEKCNKCNFSERRVTDLKVPVILNFKDKNKMNLKIENLELLCYNCYFLHIGDVFNEKQVKNIEEDAPVKKDDQVDWEMDDNMLEHFKDIGLVEDDEEDYIARL